MSVVQELFLKNKQKEVEAGLAKQANSLANEPLGYGLTKGEVSRMFGIPVTEVGNMSDRELQQIGAMKQASINNQKMATSSQSLDPAVANMINANREYIANKPGKMPVRPSAEDVQLYAQDGVDVVKNYNNEMDDYLYKKAMADRYESNVDPVAADKWRNYGLGQELLNKVQK